MCVDHCILLWRNIFLTDAFFNNPRQRVPLRPNCFSNPRITNDHGFIQRKFVIFLHRCDFIANDHHLETLSETGSIQESQVGAVMPCLAFHLWGLWFESYRGHYVDWVLQSLLDCVGFPWNNSLGFSSHL